MDPYMDHAKAAYERFAVLKEMSTSWGDLSDVAKEFWVAIANAAVNQYSIDHKEK